MKGWTIMLPLKLHSMSFTDTRVEMVFRIAYVGLCGATVARSPDNREVPGSIPGRSGKIWAVFPIPPCPCSPSREYVRDVRQGVVTSLSWKVNHGNPVVTLALCPEVMGLFPPQAQGLMSRRWAPRPCAASAYAPNFTFYMAYLYGNCQLVPTQWLWMQVS